ncbi:hypothetical protein ES705_11597 [subsurface metagenome]
METKDWKSIDTARLLLVGHDPRLQQSNTIAEYVLFANYYFDDIPESAHEKKKYGLAKSTFDHVAYLTNEKFKAETIYITNLCNSQLEHAPKGKTVLITREKAEQGLVNIKRILSENPSIEYVFPTSLQVNYWLQKLGFYNSYDDFVQLSEPKEIGLKNNPSYFQPKKSRTFTMICGKIFNVVDGHQKVIPILHSKNYPLKGRFLKAYGNGYEQIRKYFLNE